MTVSNGKSAAEVLAAVYLAGTENGLGRRLTDPAEIVHRREAFIKANPACKEALAALKEIMQGMVGEDIDKDFSDYLEDMEDWQYYSDYHNDASDFVRGYNKAKSEIRQALSKNGEE